MIFSAGQTTANSGTTYYFGTDSGDDTIYMGVNQTTGIAAGAGMLTIAYSDGFGASSAEITYTEATSAASVSVGSSNIYIVGLTSGAVAGATTGLSEKAFSSSEVVLTSV